PAQASERVRALRGMESAQSVAVSTAQPTLDPPAASAAPSRCRTLCRLFDLHLTIGALLLAGAALAHASRPLPAGAFAALFAVVLLSGGVLRRFASRTGDDLDAARLTAELHATVARLAASEERYREMVENAGDA